MDYIFLFLATHRENFSRIKLQTTEQNRIKVCLGKWTTVFSSYNQLEYASENLIIPNQHAAINIQVQLPERKL